MITRQHTQESLSRAYASIIAGVAGVNLVIGREYDYGVDGEFRTVVREGPDLIEDGHTLDFQLKSTVNWRESSDHIAYPCKLAAYNKLAFRANSSPTRCILILLCLPREVRTWVEIDASRVILRKCCYWLYVDGPPETPADSTKTIYIPKGNLFTPGTLRQHLDIIKSGGRP